MTMTKKLFLLVDKVFYKAQNPPKKLPAAMDGLTWEKDIVHSAQYADWKLDLLYRKREDGSLYPVVFEIHGGGFSAGDKRYRLYHAAQMANRGAMVVNVNHPLGPEVICPEPMRCLTSAFNWVIANAERLHLDTSRMLVTGDSSGAYYSAMLAVTQDDPKLQEVYGRMDGRFSHAMYVCGLYDMANSLSHKLPFGITTGVCIDISGRKPKDLGSWEYFPYISPIDFVTASHPKALVVYAVKDFFCKGQAEDLVAKLQGLGIDVQSFGSTKFADNHAFAINNNNRIAQEARAKMYDYVEAFCKGEV